MRGVFLGLVIGVIGVAAALGLVFQFVGIPVASPKKESPKGSEVTYVSTSDGVDVGELNKLVAQLDAAKRSTDKAILERSHKIAEANLERDHKIKEAGLERDHKVSEVELKADLRVEVEKVDIRKKAEKEAADYFQKERDEWVKKNKAVDVYLEKMRKIDMEDAEQRRIANSVEYKRIEREVEQERENFQTILANETARHEREMDEIQDSSTRQKAMEAFIKWVNDRQSDLGGRIRSKEEKLKNLLRQK